MPYIKPIEDVDLINLARTGYSYRSAGRILKRDCTTVKTYAKKLDMAIHEQYVLNGTARQSPIKRRGKKCQ